MYNTLYLILDFSLLILYFKPSKIAPAHTLRKIYEMPLLIKETVLYPKKGYLGARKKLAKMYSNEKL